MEPLKTTKELASYYQVTITTIQAWVKEGMPVEMKTGNRNRFKFEDVQQWHNERTKEKEQKNESE